MKRTNRTFLLRATLPRLLPYSTYRACPRMDSDLRNLEKKNLTSSD